MKKILLAFVCLCVLPASEIMAGGGEEKPKVKTAEDHRREELAEIVKKILVESEHNEILMDELNNSMDKISHNEKGWLNKNLGLMFQQLASFKERSSKWDGSARELEVIKEVVGRIEQSYSMVKTLHEKYVKKSTV